jgi:Tfp pilus assembly protein PilF
MKIPSRAIAATLIFGLGLGLVIGGCSTVKVAPLAESELWQDEAFHYDPSRVTVDKKNLFALDADLLESLKGERMEKASAQKRVDRLTALLYGPRDGRKIKAFPYDSGHSSIAADTWRRRRADCLSLNVLAYAIARAMDLPVQMQDVRVPMVIDRANGVDYVAGHVNLLIKNGGRLQLVEGFGIGDVIIDFEPQVGSRREGIALSEDAILARFYNNLAAEYLAEGKSDLAYAHFKAAILTDPSFSPGFGNLALLYKRQGLFDSAERLLRHAIALNIDDDVAMSSLHQLLLVQNRDAEAAVFAKLLDSRREQNPYYWIGMGIDHFRKEDFRRAINAFEHAEALSTGFEEVHRFLAMAYQRVGDAEQAKKQVAVLAALASGDPLAGTVGSKKKLLLTN